MEGLEKQPHILLTREDVRPVVLTVGDPGRAEALAAICEQSRALAFNREYRSFDCAHEGASFTVISHGIGGAGSAICFEELIHLGAKVIIRVGTCGSLHPASRKQGDVVVLYAASREDGVSALLVHSGFPSVADPYVCTTMMECAKEHGTAVKLGITATRDLFYESPVMPNSLATLARAGCDVVDMETSTLFVVARLRGVKAGCICTVDGSPLQWEEGNYDPTGSKVIEGKKRMLEIAVKTAVKLTYDKQY